MAKKKKKKNKRATSPSSTSNTPVRTPTNARNKTKQKNQTPATAPAAPINPFAVLEEKHAAFQKTSTQQQQQQHPGSGLGFSFPHRFVEGEMDDDVAKEATLQNKMATLRVEKVIHSWNKGISRENSLLVNGQQLSAMGGGCGDVAIVQIRPKPEEQSKRQHFVCRLWPHAKVEQRSCRIQLYTCSASQDNALPANGIVREDDIIRVCMPPATPLHCKEATVSGPVLTYYERVFVQQSLHGRFAIDGSVVAITVHGVPQYFTIHDIRGIEAVVVVEPPCSSEEKHKDKKEEQDDAKAGPQVFRISSRTRLMFDHGDGNNNNNNNTPQDHKDEEEGHAPPKKISFDDIGGLSQEIQAVMDVVDQALTKPDVFKHSGLNPPRGVLLYGPPGTGKTMIARAIAAKSTARMIVVSGSDIASKYVGESEERLKDVFHAAARSAPAIIFFDEIDAFAPNRDEVVDENKRRIVATLLTLMDGMESLDRVVVLAATNRPNTLDPALRRAGRFDREIEIGIPTETGRREILETILRNVSTSLTESDITHVAKVTHGFVGADLRALCREAAMITMYKQFERQEQEQAAAEEEEHKNDADPYLLSIGAEEMRKALTIVKPSAMREVLVDIPKVTWDDIGGQEEIKQKLKEAIEWPLQYPDVFERLGVRPPKGILLYGPPGCSKTLMAKAVANECSRNFIAVKGPELFSKWVGDSEKAVKEVFRKARAASPSVVFFDEIDSISAHRSGDADGDRVAGRVLSQLLIELDGVEDLGQVTVIAATNRPDVIDTALMRPGRIDRILYVAPPDHKAATDIFRICLKDIAHSKDDVNYSMLAIMANGFSGAEIAAVCRQGAVIAMEENQQAQTVEMKHLVKAVTTFTPRITPDMIQFYEDYRKKSRLTSL